MKICLDYGHGGKDSGATNGKVYEKDLVVQIGRKLEEQLKKNNIQYVLTRKNDEYVQLLDRCKIANNNKVDLFISIHINSSDNLDANGIEVCRYKGNHNQQLAKKVCDAMCKTTNARNRGSKERNDLCVLNSTYMDAMLLECGFLSNSDELKKLVDEEYQWKLVEGICNGLGIKFIHEDKKEDEKVSTTYKTATVFGLEGDDKLNRRKEPKIADNIVGQLKNGDRIQIDREENGFSHCRWGYWVSSQYLKPAENVSDSPINKPQVKKAEYINNSLLHIVKIPKDSIAKLDFVNIKGGMRVADVKSKYNPNVIINGTLYDMVKGLNYIDVVDENVRSGYLGADEGIGIVNRNDTVWCTGDKARKDNTIVDWIGGIPTLVIDGKVNIKWGDKYDSYLNGCHQRSVFAYDKNNVYFICTKGEVKLESLAKELVRIGITHAINMDGGGSSTLWFDDKKYKTSGRKNASWLICKTK